MKRLLCLSVILLVSVVAIAQSTKTSKFIIKELPKWQKADIGILNYQKQIPELIADSLCSELFYWTNYSRKHPKLFWDSVVNPFLRLYPQFNTPFAATLKKDLLSQKDTLPFLKYSSTLTKLAQEHALDLKSNWPNISHHSSSGKSFAERVQSFGSFSCAGENIGVGNPDVVLQLIFLYIDEGLADLGHRKTLLSPKFSNMGIAKSEPIDGVYIYVQDLSCN